MGIDGKHRYLVITFGDDVWGARVHWDQLVLAYQQGRALPQS